MPDETPSGQRKRLRVGHVSERGGINAVRTLLEAHGMVVDEVDGRSDYGRDLNVDITENGQVTGAVIGVQVKGDRRFIRNGDWELPATPKDRRYWAESSVPIVGILLAFVHRRWGKDLKRWLESPAHRALLALPALALLWALLFPTTVGG